MFVFRPRRHKRPLWYGRYQFDDMQRPRDVCLDTLDELVARKRLTDLVIRLQREREGILPPRAQVVAAGAPLPDLVRVYGQDLSAQACTAQHVKDTTRRILRLARAAKWRTLHDVTAVSFTAWRGRVAATMSAKTLKEYQVSANAFFRWLIMTGQLATNPLHGVRFPNTKGRAVRRRRALTPDEIRRLLVVAEHRRLPYLFLLYTGLRFREGWGLLWRDVRLDDPTGPHILLRDSETKDRDARAVPLHPALVAELRAHMAARTLRDTDDSRVFRGIYPAQKDTLGKDLARAGVEKTNERGVIDWHAFRKTWQTMAVRAGIPLRVSQAILGHSTPELTANAYTDVAGLELHTEAARLPWYGAA